MAKENFTPYIPHTVTLPEFTVKAILLGIFLAVIMAAANAYLGLYVGMTVSASIPAAVISMAVLRSLRKGGLVKDVNILENNLVQTIASAGEALAAGVIFTIPALLLMDIWTEVDYTVTTVAAILGGTLGVLFSVSLRRILIIQEKLPYPEGVACAEVLEAGEKGGRSVKFVFTALFIGALFKFSTLIENTRASLSLWRGNIDNIVSAGAAKFRFGANFSVALLGVGYIVGPRIASFIFIGGFIGSMVVLPIVTGAVELHEIYTPEHRVKFVGAGAMLVGGVYTLWVMRSALLRGIREGISGLRQAKAPAPRIRTEQDIPLDKAFLVAGLLAFPVFLLYLYLTESIFIAIIAALVMVAAGYIFAGISGYITGVVGSSNNPLSGMTIIVLIFTALLLFGLGARGELGMAATIGVAVVVACAAGIAGDNLHDLKAGYLVGSTPKYLQIGLIIGVAAGALVIAPVLNVLNEAYVIGSPNLVAPQADLMAKITQGVFNNTMDWAMVFAGMFLAFCLIAVRHLYKIEISIMAVAVGIYLPFMMSTPIMLGGLIRYFADRRIDSKLKEKYKDYSPKVEKFKKVKEKLHSNGVLFSSGLIAGEAIMGVILAGFVVSGVSTALISSPIWWPGMLIFLYVALLIGYLTVRDLD